ncbi:MAG: apolipoprotein N-acyltransferase, partial [Methylococcales bacterium]
LLFWGWYDAKPLRASLRGFLFGSAQFAFGLYWIYVCLHGYAGASTLSAFVFTAAAAIFLGLFLGVFSFLTAKIVIQSRATTFMLVYPSTWILSEWLRAWLEFPGCPWLQTGYSQIDSIPAGFGPVLGAYGVGFFTAFSTGAFLYCFEARGRARIAVPLLLTSLWALAALLQSISWTGPAGGTLKVALLQGNIAQKLKWLPETKQQTLRWYIDTSRAHWDADLIIWPETAVPISYHQVLGLFAELGEEAARHGSDLLIGLPIDELDLKRSFNAMIAIGNAQGRYLKRHLVPFGEYMPLEPFSGLLARYADFQLHVFSPGSDRQATMKAAGFPLAPSICYESMFGQEMLASMPDAAYLVNITNDGWFGHSIALDQNLQMARMRALETGRYMLRAGNTGLTAIISPRGHLVEVAPRFTATVLTGEFQPMRGVTPYM